MFMHAAVRKNHPRSGVGIQNQCVSRSVSVGQCRRKDEILCRRSSIIITLTADGDPHAASTHKHRSTRRSSSLNQFGAADRSTVGQFIHSTSIIVVGYRSMFIHTALAILVSLRSHRVTDELQYTHSQMDLSTIATEQDN